MQIIVNEIEYCKINVQYESDADAIKTKKIEVLNKFKEQKLPGFRPGKAPISAISQHYRKEINELLKRELAEEAVQNVVFEKNLKPFGQPSFSSISLEEPLIALAGEQSIPKFKCEFSMHIQPEFTLGSYKDFEIPKPAGIMQSEELTQRMIQDLRTKNGQTIPYGENDFVQMGDTVIIDYHTLLDGASIESLTADAQIVNIGRINIPGFSESLLGMKIDDSREFDLVMPETYEEYAGKTLHFKVKVNMGSKSEPAPLDDNLAIKIGAPNIDSLMENARATATSRVKELETNQILDQISHRLIDGHDFKIPEWISIAEAQINAKNAGQEWASISDQDKEKHIVNADNSIKLSLILQKVRDNEPDAQLSDEEVFGLAKQNIAKYAKEPDAVMSEIFKNGHLPILFNRIRDEHTLAFIQKNSTIIE